MKDITKIIKSLKASALMKKGGCKTVKKELEERWIYWCIINYIRC